MLRRMLKREIEKVADGEDPVGASFDKNARLIEFDAGRVVIAHASD